MPFRQGAKDLHSNTLRGSREISPGKAVIPSLEKASVVLSLAVVPSTVVRAPVSGGLAVVLSTGKAEISSPRKAPVRVSPEEPAVEQNTEKAVLLSPEKALVRVILRKLS